MISNFYVPVCYIRQMPINRSEAAAAVIQGALRDFSKRLEKVFDGSSEEEQKDEAAKSPLPTATQLKQLEAFCRIQAYMVPSLPEIPLPPPLLDQETIHILGKKLYIHVMSLVSNKSIALCRAKNEPKKSAPITGKLVDVTKAAAATGGGQYNAKEDPLNAPAVLTAV